MLAKREIWNYSDSGHVWTGIYKNSHNLLHWHFDCELVCVERGSIDIFCEKRKYSLTEGQSLFIDSGQMHYLQAKSPDTLLMTVIFDYNLLKPFAEKARLACPKLCGDYGIPAFYSLLRRILTEKKPYYNAEAACEVTRKMIDVFRREPLVSRSETNNTSQSFKRLLEDINENYRYYTFETAVSFMGMSEAHFSRYFRSMAGVTFSQYLNYVRIDNAVRLLQADQDIPATDVADECGFGTIRNFNRIFKDLTGYPPKHLPADFTLETEFFYPSNSEFNPTLTECELVDTAAN